MLRDAHVHDAPAFRGQDHEHEQEAARGGRDHEEVRGDDLADVNGQETSATFGTAGVRVGPCTSRRSPD
jgi:hypothetical protein